MATEVKGLIKELADRISYAKLAEEINTTEDELKQWAAGNREYPPQKMWDLVRSSSMHRLFDLLPAHGLTPVSFDISAPLNLEAAPVGFDQEPPRVQLRNNPTDIAGYQVDFPLGLPASVLAANAKWIEFYARRGFDILTYKTVRTEFRKAHDLPNWVFLENPTAMTYPCKEAVVGYPGDWPKDITTASMANSFGVPSLAPDWWQEDVRRARRVIREGHQVLIVSVVASKNETQNSMIADFVEVALMAKNAGADIIEANFSCPNTPGDRAGEVYQLPDVARCISQAMREALGTTPLFVKIGYLPKQQLHEFVEFNAEFVDGIVAINTISAEVVERRSPEVTTAQKILEYLRALNSLEPLSIKPTFPGRNTAGISGWAIKARAQEVAQNLVAFGEEMFVKINKRLTILGLGGVLTPEDFDERLATGVNAVESCTGAFLDPNLGLKIRSSERATRKK